MKNTKRRLLLIIFLVPLVAFAQRTAVVLSGGGAKGLSHVGVLKALEDAEVPVDYIVGNSMGALIGALYASGFSPDEIEAFVLTDQFTDWVTGNIDERFFFEKSYDANASMVSLPFSVGKRFRSRLPSSFISPYLMDYAVMETFAAPSAVAGYDFDRLFVPFRCVASDIDSSKLVVLRSGQLGTAVRASSTFPFLFRPIRIDGTLLFDGGMYNNFPADVAIDEFQPDVIIGSKAVGNYPPPEETNMMSQVQNMLMRKADFSIPEQNGVLIESKLGPAALLDFSAAQAYIDSGYVAAMRQIPRLQKLVSRKSKPDSLQARRSNYRNQLPELLIDTVIISGVNPNQAHYIAQRLNYRDRFTKLEDLSDNYLNLLSDDRISYIFPELIYDTLSSRFAMHLNVLLADNFQVEFGGNVSSSATNEAYIGIRYRSLGKIGKRAGVNAYYGRFYSSFQANGHMDLPGAMPFYLDGTLTLSRKDYFKNANYFFEDPTPAFLINDENFMDVRLGHLLGKYAKVGVGFAFGQRDFEYYQTNDFSRNDTTDLSRFNYINPYVMFELNSLNRKMFASAGMKWGVSVKYFQGQQSYVPGSNTVKMATEKSDQDFFRAKIYIENYFAQLGQFSFGFLSDLVYSNQPLLADYTSSILSAPSFEPVSEMQTNYITTYRAYSYLAVGLEMVYHPLKNVDIRAELYGFQPYQRIIDHGPYQDPSLGPVISNPSVLASTRLVYHSPIGPVSLAVNYFDKSENHFSVVFNFGYLIFNRSAFD